VISETDASRAGRGGGRARRRAGRPVALAAAVLGCVLLAAGCSSSSHGSTAQHGSAQGIAPPGRDVGTELNGPVSSAIEHLPLVEADGTATDLAAFRGKVLVISDTMTLCQETCPLDTANIVQTARNLDRTSAGADVEFLSITVDPARDSPAQLAAYRALYTPPPANWQTLTGTAANIDKLWKYLGVYWQKVPEGSPPAKNWRTGQTLTYDIDHADEVFFFAPGGNERFILDGAAEVQPGTTLPRAMRDYLDADGVKNLDHPEQGSWTVPQALQTIAWLRQQAAPASAKPTSAS
jgi:protein SCO1/2